ncbi:ABC-2 type transport system ATP-binding protein [Kineococcus xinjiangensis]|uniref:ABC-2 type transport system ATP-binding protein n=1 Tax=Kineococcus xinjiangensis TaxID=512762 RepID=A0A2S6ITS6_9ACTN|nr:ABC transporter ATP-binding protein [Kineococcus xinjiangensis]PPK97657.1 ABC-2 type transport system ATP-binding protein [Kineococcus xinjiangensis]
MSGATAVPGRTALDAAVEVRAASKWFGDTVALSDVSFALRPGVTGLLGHNGAGKSTVLSLLSGAARPSQGEVRVLGVDPHSDLAVHRRLGVVPDGEGTWAYLTARQNVALLAKQRGVADPRAAAGAALERVGLSHAADRRVGGFSKGMRQRVKLAQALAHDPEVLLLDEPLNGLDPVQRRADVELVRALGAEGRTVLVSSHVLGEVERMADEVLVVVNGRLVAEGEPAAIRDLMTDRPRTLRLAGRGVAALAGVLLGEGLVTAVRHDVAAGVRSDDEEALVVETPAAMALATRLPALARDCAATLRRVEAVGDDLESVFAHLTAAARGVGR